MSLVTRDYVRTMARYNAWQNKGLRGILQAMDPKDLTRNRKAFFGSIMGTANHLLWGDLLWMARFDGGTMPGCGIKQSVDLTATLAEWETLRYRTDGRIRAWADGLRQIDITGPLTFTSVSLGKQVTKPMGLCIAHFFNHQTHHRGQIHAMLTAAGQTPIDSDLFLMPEGT